MSASPPKTSYGGMNMPSSPIIQGLLSDPNITAAYETNNSFKVVEHIDNNYYLHIDKIDIYL